MIALTTVIASGRKSAVGLHTVAATSTAKYAFVIKGVSDTPNLEKL
jgi:hypothetical protein